MTERSIEQLWSESLVQFDQYHHLLNKMLTDYRADLVPWLEKVLFSRPDMPLALLVVDKLSIEEKKLLFPSLVLLASKTVPHTVTVRNIVTSLPRDWVLRNVERVAKGILEQGDAETCRRILELYSELDKTLLFRECRELSNSSRPDLQSVAAEFTG
jgi:hypothetical protein